MRVHQVQIENLNILPFNTVNLFSVVRDWKTNVRLTSFTTNCRNNLPRTDIYKREKKKSRHFKAKQLLRYNLKLVLIRYKQLTWSYSIRSVSCVVSLSWPPFFTASICLEVQTQKKEVSQYNYKNNFHHYKVYKFTDLQFTSIETVVSDGCNIYTKIALWTNSTCFIQL